MTDDSRHCVLSGAKAIFYLISNNRKKRESETKFKKSQLKVFSSRISVSRARLLHSGNYLIHIEFHWTISTLISVCFIFSFTFSLLLIYLFIIWTMYTSSRQVVSWEPCTSLQVCDVVWQRLLSIKLGRNSGNLLGYCVKRLNITRVRWVREFYCWSWVITVTFSSGSNTVRLFQL